LNTYNAPALLEGGREFTEAVATPDALGEAELQAAIKASRPSAPTPSAPAPRAEPRKKLLRLREDPKFGVVPMEDLREIQIACVSAADEHTFGVTFTLFWGVR
jgi:hypothetical protein